MARSHGFGLLGLLALSFVIAPSGSAQASGQLCNNLAVTVFLGNGDVPTGGDDVIAGTPERDVINAGAGNDTICGLGENDSIFGGVGNDVIVGGAGHDILTGGLGDDLLLGGRGRDLLVAGPGDDVMRSGAGSDWCTDEGDTKGCEEVVAGAVGEGDAPVLQPPLDRYVVGSRYGLRLHPILGYERMHNGVDFRGLKGDKIRAMKAGVVTDAGKSGGFGKRVVIDHGEGWSSLSAHMWRIRVKEGQWVEVGDVIGRVGSTGLSTGPHLHLEVRLGSIRLDPLLFIDPPD